MRKKIIAVISSYNRGRAIKPTVISLLNQTYALSKIIIIDDGSSKEKAVPVFQSKKVEVVRLKQNVGVVWGRNLGLTKGIQSDFILFIDDDIILDKNCVRELLSVFEEKKNAVGAMPVVYFKSQKDTVWSSGSGVNLLTGQTLFFTQKPKETYTPIPAATSILLASTPAIRKAGWYDPIFYFCYEDADFYFRLSEKNKGNIYAVKSASAYHDIPLNLSLDRVAKRSYHIARGRVLFLSRHSKYYPFNLVFVFLFGAYYLSLGIKYGKYRSGFMYFKGMIDGLLIVLSGKSQVTDVVLVTPSIDLDKIKTPAFLRSSKVRD